MTTEVVVLNKHGVALAADSAVTVRTSTPGGAGEKTFPTANKVFALSGHAPAGIMAFGDAEFMGVPWETIVKMYRGNLGGRRFPHLRDYCDDFISYLASFDFTRGDKENYLLATAHSIFSHHIRERVDEEVETLLADTGQVDDRAVRRIVAKRIAEADKEFRAIAKKGVLSRSKKTAVARSYRKKLLDVAKEVFGGLPLTAKDRSRLVTTAVNGASTCPKNAAGVVVAGFGEDDVFPSYVAHDVAGLLAGQVVFGETGSTSIRSDNEAVVAAFAQMDEVRTFMEGIGPDIARFFEHTLAEMMKKHFPCQLADAIRDELNLSRGQWDKLLAIARKMGQGAFDTIHGTLKKIQRERYVDPIVNTTAFLQKGELATMAETLVSMVSFRKQVSLESETVGGPIDVAVISKGDGLVWVKRKHYFQPELNPQFFSTHFPRGGADA